jgi:hypothetical protein
MAMSINMAVVAPSAPVVAALGPDVGAGGPLERPGRFSQFTARVCGRGLGERVEHLAVRGDHRGDLAVVALVDDE